MADGTLRGVTRLVAMLRAGGLDVGTHQTIQFAEALALAPPWTADDIGRIARICFVRRPEDAVVLERVLATLADDHRDHRGRAESRGSRDAPQGDDARGASTATTSLVRPSAARMGERASTLERLRRLDFAACTDSELAAMREEMRRLTLDLPLRPSRRARAAVGGQRLHYRRLLRILRDPAPRPGPERIFRTRALRPRRMVWLIDVSGSMTEYSRALLQFAHITALSGSAMEAFAFGTRLTRLTPRLRIRDPDEALGAIASTTLDAHSGTRIGPSLANLVWDWRYRDLVRGAVVIVFSDGLERGDPAPLEDAMRLINRLANRVVWANPLKRYGGYQPVAHGMAAALPFVDHLVASHDLASLSSLVDLVGTLRDRSRRPAEAFIGA